MMVESVDTADFKWSRSRGNGGRDALKVGELSATLYSSYDGWRRVTMPSQAGENVLRKV